MKTVRRVFRPGRRGGATGTAAGSWAGVIERAIRIVFCFSLLAFLAAQWACFAEVGTISAVGLGALGLMTFVSGLLGVLMIRRRESTPTAACAVVVICILYFAVPVGLPATAPWWMTVSAPVVIAFIVLAVRGHLVHLAVASYVVVDLVAQVLHGTVDSLTSAVTSAGVLVAGALAVRPAVRELRNGAATTDVEGTRRRAQRRQELEWSALVTQTRWVDRMLHDDVVHALRAVSLVGKIPEPEIREFAAGAARRVRDSALPVDDHSSRALDDDIRHVIAASGLAVTATLQTTVAPADVARAMALSVREALRNTRIHSGVFDAEISLSSDGEAVTVTVIDRGCGFDSTTTHPGHMGVDESIGQRMKDVGGTVAVDSSPLGTSVTLRWREPRSVSPVRDSNDGQRVSGAQRAVAAGCSAFVVLDCVQALVKFHTLANPWPATIATAVVALAWLWALRCLLDLNTQVLRRVSVVLSLTGVACAALGALSLAPSSADATDYWLACGTAPLILVAVLLRPVKDSWWAAALAVLTPIGCVIAQGCTLQRLVGLGPAVLAPVYVMGAAYLMAFIVDRLADRAAEEWNSALLSAQRVAVLRRREQVLALRLSNLRDQVLPLLDGIGQGRLSITDDVIARAAFCEAQVRDQIGGRAAYITADMQHTLERARATGVTVDVRVDVPMDSRTADVMMHALRLAEAVGGPHLRLTMTSNDRGASIGVTPCDTRLLAGWRSLDVSGVSVGTDEESFAVLRCPARNGSAEAVRSAPVREHSTVDGLV